MCLGDSILQCRGHSGSTGSLLLHHTVYFSEPSTFKAKKLSFLITFSQSTLGLFKTSPTPATESQSERLSTEGVKLR